MTDELRLLYPEWQGGPSPAVRAGAHWLAAALFADATPLTIDVPAGETPILSPEGVRGLGPLAARFRQTLDLLTARQPSRLSLVGGTCGAEAAPVAYLNARYQGDLAVVWFDAHADLNTPQSSPSGCFHGMILRTLLGEGPAEFVAAIPRPLRPAQVFLVGARDLDPGETEFVARHGIPLLAAVDRTGGEALRDRLRKAGFRRVYIHFDVDVLDPAAFAGMLMPTPRGPSLSDAAACLRALTDAFEVVGASVVEYTGRTEASREALLRLLAEGGLRPRCSG